mmetsp:Transcript_3686/g.5558  ORF Transcript_3686/g.5558 Transcript_3686/m.5558 type:complete len:102 (-) Transcript_3686:680-985(-)
MQLNSMLKGSKRGSIHDNQHGFKIDTKGDTSDTLSDDSESINGSEIDVEFPQINTFDFDQFIRDGGAIRDLISPMKFKIIFEEVQKSLRGKIFDAKEHTRQ